MTRVTVPGTPWENSWNPHEFRERGLKAVVAVVDEDTGEMLRQASGSTSVHAWEEQAPATSPVADGIARVHVSLIYQDAIALFADLLVVDPAVIGEEGWECLCSFYEECGPGRDRLLLIRQSAFEARLPVENLTVILAPEELSIAYLREQIEATPWH